MIFLKIIPWLLIIGFLGLWIWAICKDLKEQEAINEWQKRLLKDGKCYIRGYGIVSKDKKNDIKFNTEE